MPSHSNLLLMAGSNGVSHISKDVDLFLKKCWKYNKIHKRRYGGYEVIDWGIKNIIKSYHLVKSMLSPWMWIQSHFRIQESIEVSPKLWLVFLRRWSDFWNLRWLDIILTKNLYPPQKLAIWESDCLDNLLDTNCNKFIFVGKTEGTCTHGDRVTCLLKLVQLSEL